MYDTCEANVKVDIHNSRDTILAEKYVLNNFMGIYESIKHVGKPV